MIAALYARVSTADQEREGTSLESQTEAGLIKAKELGSEVPKDRVLQEIFSGLTLDRPKLTQLREWIRRKEIDTVIVYSTDRLSRDPVHLLLLVDEFEKAGVRIHFVTEPLDNSLEGQLLGFVRGWASKVEALKIRERTTRGKLSRAKEGKQPCGRALYGYRLVDSKHEVEPKEAEVVRMIFDCLAKEGLTLKAIQMRLNRLGIPTRSGRRWWQRATLYRMVRDEAYTGSWFYNKRGKGPVKFNGGTTVQVLKPRDEWVPVSIPAIVSPETFQFAQKQLARNAELAMRNTRRQYLLTGLLVCGKCGYKYNARAIRGHTYYSCNSKLGTITPNHCPSRYVQGKDLEPLVWDAVSKLLAKPDLIINEMQKRADHDPKAHIEASLEMVKQALERNNSEIDRMLDAYKAGAIDTQLLKREMDKIRQEQVKLARTKSELEADSIKTEAQEANLEKIYEFCRHVPMLLGNLGFEEKRQILREVVDTIVVDGKNVTIYGIIPTPEEAEDVSVGLPSS